MFKIIKDTKIKAKIYRELVLDGVWWELNKKWIFLDKVGRALIDKQKTSSKTAHAVVKMLKTEQLIFIYFDSFLEGEGKI